MQNRAKRKTITQKVILGLIKVSEKKGKFERKKFYWNTYHCQNKIVTSDSRQYGNYCKTRVCATCSANRKAEIINKYLPVIKTWEAPYFVPLTVRSVPAHKLNYVISKGLIRGLKIIVERYKKRNQRGNGIKLMGIKSLECNFNPVKRTYNPHFHIIVPYKETADILVKEWLALWKNKWTNKLGQHSRMVDDLEKDMIETIKYGSKIFTDPLMRKKSKQKITPYIYASALDNIIWAMKGHRIFGSFGFNLHKTNKIKGGKSTKLYEHSKWNYDPKQADWVNALNPNIKLTGYVCTNELITILENNIDTLLE